jgi:hypothetical protein
MLSPKNLGINVLSGQINTPNNLGSKPVDGNPLPHKMALWKQKRPIEKNPEFEIRKYGK